MTHDTSTHVHNTDPPWSTSNFRERLKARRQRFAEAAARQQDKCAVTIDIQQCNILAAETSVQPTTRREYETAHNQPFYAPITWRILRAVSEEFQMPVSEILDRRQDAKYTLPRFVAIGLMLDLTNMSLPAIGRRLGGRDHTTVIHGKKRLNGLLESESFRNRFDQMKAHLS